MKTELWTEKHKPRASSEIAGQAKTVSEVLAWLASWKPGKALFLYGPPGIGKNLIVETLAHEKSCDLLQLDASDERGKGVIDSLLGGSSKVRPLFRKGRFILVDEADGISGNDRGAVASIIKVVKESCFPVFIIANDPWVQKLRPLRACCKLVRVNRVNSLSIEKRLREICVVEGLKYEDESIKTMARWSQGDMRSAINDLQMICHGRSGLLEKDMESLGFRERENEIFGILPSIFNSKRISATSKAVWDTDKDPDELLWWIESNLQLEMKSPEELAGALDLLSRADMFRALVSKQQNWRFKAFMVDLMSSVSLFKRGEAHGYVAYKPPKKLAEMGRTMIRRAQMKSLAQRVGLAAHGSTRGAKRDYFPLLRILTDAGKGREKSGFTVELGEEDVKLLKG